MQELIFRFVGNYNVIRRGNTKDQEGFTNWSSISYCLTNLFIQAGFDQPWFCCCSSECLCSVSPFMGHLFDKLNQNKHSNRLIESHLTFYCKYENLTQQYRVTLCNPYTDMLKAHISMLFIVIGNGIRVPSSNPKQLYAVLNKSWKQHSTKKQLFGNLPPILQTVQVR